MSDESPRAVLFDFGGVIGEVVKTADGVEQLLATIQRLLALSGTKIADDDLRTDLELGLRAYEGLKRAQSRMRDPRELTHREFWELTCCDWPEQARTALLSWATPLCKELELTTIRRPARADAAEVLKRLRRNEIRTALVCNCLSGEAAREQLAQDGLTGLFDVEIYSDELGYRKPGPTIVRAALTAVGVDAADAWFVGDRMDRDILAARRAGIGTAVLFRTPSPGAAIRGAEPDHEVDSLSELADLASVPA